MREKFSRISSDPQNKNDMRNAAIYLERISKYENSDLDEWVIESVRNKSVLDVGFIEHDVTYMFKEKWKHAHIAKSAKSCKGIDYADQSLIDLARNHGYDVEKCDATSNIDLGHRFDVVNIGDVIEHVNNPVSLLEFAERHLNSGGGGTVFVTTPSPYFYVFLRSIFSGKTYIPNLDHVRWVTPANMLELSSRSGLNLIGIRYFLPERLGFFRRYLRRKFPELFSMTYLYILSRNEDG